MKQRTWMTMIAAGLGVSLTVQEKPVAAQTFLGATPSQCAAALEMSGARTAKKSGYIDEIQNVAREGEDFRRVLYTGENLQLVIMTIQAGEHSGVKTRTDHDIFVRIAAGTGEVSIDGTVVAIDQESGIVIPATAPYQLTNTGSVPLRLFLIYSAPEFASNSVRKTLQEANSIPDAFDGCTTE
jgi:mannose-6-phosphate isomerase-like protein (cupin superfamily)